MNKIFVNILFFLCSSHYIYSQTQGFVLDTDNSPISEVDVYFVDQDLLVKSNDKGEFSINTNVPINTLISFYKHGYASKTVRYNNESDFVVNLYKMHVDLDEVGVQDTYSVFGSSKLVNVEKKSLRSDLLISSSMAENISQLSGVDLISSGPGIQKFVVRGLSGMRVSTYLNGMRIENQQWANDHGIGFTDLGLYEVELIKGSSALIYGSEAVGGILYFKDNPFIESNGSGYFTSKFHNSNYLFGNKLGFNYSKNNYYINIHAQNQISSDYRLPNNRYLFNSRFRNQAVKLSVAHRSNKWQNVLRYQFNAEQKGIPAHVHGDPTNVDINSVTSTGLILSEDFKLTRPTQIIDNHLIIYEGDYFLENNKFSFFLGHYINRLNEYEKWTYPAFDMSLATTNMSARARTFLKDYTINYGVQAGKMTNKNNINTYLIPDVSVSDYGIYSTIDYSKENIGINAGIRFDFKETNCTQEQYDEDFSVINSSAGIYLVNNKSIIRLTYASAFRSPHLSELFSEGVHHGTNRYELGNSELTTEKSHQFDLKFHGSNDHFGIVINPFLQNIADFISINPRDSLFDNTYRIYDYVQFNKVVISGCEFNLHYHPHWMHNLHFEQSFTLINTENLDNNTFLALTPSNKIKSVINFDLSKYSIGSKIKSFTLYHLYSFAQENVVDNESPTMDYNVLNLALNFSWSDKSHIVFGINNILNVEYVPHLSRVKEVGTGIPNPGRSFNINFKYDF